LDGGYSTKPKICGFLRSLILTHPKKHLGKGSEIWEQLGNLWENAMKRWGTYGEDIGERLNR
jgi:hypothetical protein